MLIRGGTVLIREEAQWRFLKTDLRVEGGRIAAVEETIEAKSNEKVVDASGQMILPGLIDAHVHSYSNLLKGTTWGEPLELWSLGTVALGGALTAEEMALSARLGMAEMLRRGVTGCVDHIPHSFAVDAIAAEYRSAGFRAGIAPMLHDRSDHLLLKGMRERLPSRIRKELERAGGKTTADRKEECEQWIARWHHPQETVSVLVGPNSPQRCTRELLEMAGELAQQNRLGVHAHLLETRWQRDTAQGEGDPLIWLKEAGLLGKQTALAHCVWLTDKQITLIEECGCTVVHNPTSNLFLGSGAAPVGELLAVGVPMAFGSDGSNCATNHNMLEIARTALLLQRGYEHDPQKWMPAQAVWDGLTVNGAKTLRQEGVTGQIEKGARADMVFCRMSDPAWWPEVDRVEQMLLNLSQLDIDSVMVNGVFLMEAGNITAFDEQELLEQLREKGPQLKKKFQQALQEAEGLRPYYEAGYREAYLG